MLRFEFISILQYHEHCDSWEVVKMWKYIGKEECNEFLLSLKLFNCKDKKKYLNTIYSISNNVENNYKIYKIKKKNGKYRTIYEPNSLLKHIQRQILVKILDNKAVSKYAKAYHKGINLKDNAIPHLNKELILKLDIKDFFENISFIDVYNSCFSIEYFPKSVGMILTYLCTYDDYLMQGAPTSAYISNFVFKSTICTLKIIFGFDFTSLQIRFPFAGRFNGAISCCFIRFKESVDVEIRTCSSLFLLIQIEAIQSSLDKFIAFTPFDLLETNGICSTGYIKPYPCSLTKIT